MNNRYFLLLTVFCGLSLVLAGNGRAAALCQQLTEQLASLPEVIGSSVQARAISNAITQQNLEMRKAERQARERNCPTASITTIGAAHDPVCDEIAAAIANMDANQKHLASQYESVSRAASLTARRARLRAALTKNACSGQEVATTDSAARKDDGTRPSTDFFANDGSTGPDYGGPAGGDTDRAPDSGPLRTVCVRTCDGAFFPISSHATPVDFDADARTCQQMCPGAVAELYYHALMSQESDDMISTQTGRNYSELPSAYAYRTAKSPDAPACGCNFSAYYKQNMPQDSQLGSRTRESHSYSSITTIPLVPKQTIETSIDPRERAYDPEKDGARQVGPAFVPMETTSIDLTHPADEGAQPQQ